ncbi:MAG: SUMF1/EgtB/PvdO family nonheme iron enzyme, partial [Dehalococcoidia bacterium]|nr:SUMF1/EgtB/PvdO family nonheme iron enzyme [Dehalococcoidia bacterium]
RIKAKQEAVAQAAAEREAKINSLLQEAKTLQGKGEFAPSLEKCFGVLALDSGNQTALDLVRQAKSGLSVTESLAAGQRFLTEGDVEYVAKRYQAAEAKFATALGFFLAAEQAAPTNQEVQQLIRQAQGLGTIRITSTPSGAEVTLTPLNMETLALVPEESRVVGVTPLTLDDLLPREYSIILRHPEYPEARFPVLLNRHGREDVSDWPLAVPEGMVLVPGGTYFMGDEFSNQGIQQVQMNDFYLDQLEVTNAAYSQFVAETGRKPPEHWGGAIPPREIWRHPVTFVTWQDATAYASWAGKRLPTNEEWERAARGIDKRMFSWGNIFRQEVCHSSNQESPIPAGSYPANASPYGVLDMTGNAGEWAATRITTSGGVELAYWRGGGYTESRKQQICSTWNTWNIDRAHKIFGFRCAKDAPTRR